MIRDDIYSSKNSFTCSNCRKEYPPGTLVNVFDWDERISLYCLKCLKEMGLEQVELDVLTSNQKEWDPK